MKLNIELYLKVDFLVTGWVYKRPITGIGNLTHIDGLDFQSFYTSQTQQSHSDIIHQWPLTARLLRPKNNRSVALTDLL